MFISPRNSPNNLPEGFYERFYSFIDLERSHLTQRRVVAQWKWDRETRQHMKQLLGQEPEESKKNEQDWVIYFCEKLFIESDLKWTKRHLLAYLQDACNMTRYMIQDSTWFRSLWPKATAPEIFIFINEILAQDLQTLIELGTGKYDFSKFSYTSFNRSMVYKIVDKTKEKLIVGKQITKYRKAALLKKVSKKNIEKALEAQGVTKLVHNRQIYEILKQIYQDQDDDKINQKLQLWNCYQDLSQLERLRFKKINLDKINKRQKQIIANCYESRTYQSISANEVQEQLSEIYKIINKTSTHYQYILIWKIYNRLAVHSELPKNQDISHRVRQIIAYHYNRQRPYPLVVPALNERDIHEYLDFCVDAIRKQYKTIEHLVDQDAESFSNPVQQLEQQENAGDNRKDEIQYFLQEKINKLSLIDRWVLKLGIGLGINQTDIGTVFEVDQATITRWIQRAKQTLLKEISIFVKQKWNIELNTETISNEIFILLDQSLAKAIHIEIWDILQSILKQKTEHQITLLKSWNAILWECNGNNQSALQQVSDKFSCDSQQIKQQLDKIKQDLCLELREICQQQIQQDLNGNVKANFQDLPSTSKNLLKVVDNWLNRIAQYH